MRPRLLMLTHRVPFPADRGDRIRSGHLLRRLSERFDVSLACLSDEPVDEGTWSALREVTGRVVVRRIGRQWSQVRGVASLLAGGAATPGAFYREDLSRTIQGWHRAEPFEAVLTYCSGMIRYAHELMNEPHPPRRHVLDLVDVDSAKWAALAATVRGPRRWVYAREAARLRPIEAGRVGPVHAISVVSEAEADLWRQRHAAPHRLDVNDLPPLHVVGNGVDLDHWHPLPDRGEPVLAFVGVLDYEPNVDGVRWFANDVLPRVRAEVPAARLLVIGRRPTAAVRRLEQQPGVQVVGPVADVRPWLAQASAVVAPLRVARGVQNKVLEAMASSRAVVCTEAVARGVDAWRERELLVADEAEAFASRCVELLTNSWRRQSVAAAARKRAEERYRWEDALEPMVALLDPSAARPSVVRWAA